jgi:hypothetical protein
MLYYRHTVLLTSQTVSYTLTATEYHDVTMYSTDWSGHTAYGGLCLFGGSVFIACKLISQLKVSWACNHVVAITS